MPQVRLSEEEINRIKQTIRKYDPQAKILIFGSRTDPSKKGGDIDLLVISNNIDSITRRKIRAELIVALGDRKIDLLVSDSPERNAFIKMAYSEGVEI